MTMPAFAQADSGKVDWTGAYVGGSIGYSWQREMVPSICGSIPTVTARINRGDNFDTQSAMVTASFRF